MLDEDGADLALEELDPAPVPIRSVAGRGRKAQAEERQGGSGSARSACHVRTP